MSPFVAPLLFAFKPSEAAAALRGRGSAALLLPLPGVLVALWLRARGCAVGDAAAVGAALAALLVAVAAGGWLAAVPASRILGGAWPLAAMIGPSAAAALWAALIPGPLMMIAHAAGMKATAALFTGFCMLLWGLRVAHALLTWEGGEREGGRALVAACVAAAGSILAFHVAMTAVERSLVIALPSPIETPEMRRFDYLFVRVGATPREGEIAWLVEQGSRESAFAEVLAGGSTRFLGRFREDPEASRKWDIAGRVFFQCGGEGGGSVVGRRHPAVPR